MRIDSLTRNAISHTLHCLLGCAIGEIAGMVIGEYLGWHNVGQTLLAIALAFLFGYILTFSSFKRSGEKTADAIKGTLATDTLSITSMEIADNLFIWLIPGAISATLSMPLFWWTLFASLVVGFVVTVPVNRFLMSKGIGHGHHGGQGTSHDHHMHH